jgi:integrase
MSGRQAKILSTTDISDLLLFASCTRNPLRNRVIVLLSAKAGLRAGEIANLTWDMVLGPTGQISGVIELHDHAAKKGSGRAIPIHPDRGRQVGWSCGARSLQFPHVGARTPPKIAVHH